MAFIESSKMQSKSALRWLVVLEITLGIMGVVVERIHGFDGTFWSLNTGVPANSAFGGIMTWPQFIAGVVLIIFGIIAYIGIICFWHPARELYLLFHVLQLAARPLYASMYGPYYGTGWVSIFGCASYIVTGIILAFLYFTPLKEHFKKNVSHPTQFFEVNE